MPICGSRSKWRSGATRKKNDGKLEGYCEKEGCKMKRSKNYKFQSRKKKSGKALTISLIISGTIMTSLVVWVWLNNWDVEKSYTRIGTAIGLMDEAEPKESSEPEIDKELVGEDEPKESIEEVIKKEPEEEATKEESVKYIEGQKLPSKPTYIKDVLIASKKYPLPSTYAPGESKEAREAFEEMAAEALLDGFKLTAFSTYRSFEYQTDLYQRYVDQDGEEEADRYSARPGYSEHQTGLAFDIGELNVTDDWASERFGETEAGKWIAANAHRFGFILRYPEGKESVTGYMHESWHFRYVGVEIAKSIYKNNSTLEEYLEI